MGRKAATLAVALLLAGAGAGRWAHAQDDDLTIAQGLVRELERIGHDDARARVTTDALGRAKDAIERATRLRRSGDEAHAKAADGLAREWAETGRDLARAAEAEAKAADLRRKATAEQEQLERTRALVQEGIARVGRLEVQVAEATKLDDESRRAVEAHDGEPAPTKKPLKKEAKDKANAQSGVTP